MVWGLTRTDFKNAGQNSVYMAGHYWGGMAVAAAINIAAHRLFKLEENSWGSFAAKSVSIAAGAALSFALASRTTLIDIAQGTMLKLAAIYLAVGACAAYFSINFAITIVPPFYFGPLGECRQLLPCIGGCGSYAGVYLSEEVLYRMKKH